MTKQTPIERSSIEEATQNLSRTSVIAIGMSRYKYLAPLPGAAHDLKQLSNVMVKGSASGIYDSKHFTALANPTVEKVRHTLTDYARSRSARGDFLIFYFSGHGCVIGTSGFGFCLADTTTSAFEEGGILPLSVISFRDLVQTLAAGDIHPIFIIDACFSSAAARGFDAKLPSVMHDDLHTYAAGSYGLLCSSTMTTASVDTEAGGGFTQAFCAVIGEGLSADKQRFWPFLTLRAITQPLQARLTHEGLPLPKLYLGPDLPDIPIGKNALYKPLTEHFSPYMRGILEYIWNSGSPKEAHHEDLRNRVGPGAYGNHSKLSLPPWALVEDGVRKRTRRLTAKGEKFMRGKAKIPDRIIKDPILWEWVAAPDCKMISIDDVPYTERLV
jgi:hypothetical protein